MGRNFGFFWLLAGFLGLLAASTAGAGSAIIAVAAERPEVNAPVSAVAARSPYLLFFDERGVLLEALANPHRQAGKNAGPLLVDFLAAKGVRTFIAGEFGGKMVAAMQGHAIKHQVADGEAAVAVEAALVQ